MAVTVATPGLSVWMWPALSTLTIVWRLLAYETVMPGGSGLLEPLVT